MIDSVGPLDTLPLADFHRQSMSSSQTEHLASYTLTLVLINYNVYTAQPCK